MAGPPGRPASAPVERAGPGVAEAPGARRRGAEEGRLHPAVHGREPRAVPVAHAGDPEGARGGDAAEGRPDREHDARRRRAPVPGGPRAGLPGARGRVSQGRPAAGARDVRARARGGAHRARPARARARARARDRLLRRAGRGGAPASSRHARDAAGTPRDGRARWRRPRARRAARAALGHAPAAPRRPARLGLAHQALHRSGRAVRLRPPGRVPAGRDPGRRPRGGVRASGRGLHLRDPDQALRVPRRTPPGARPDRARGGPARRQVSARRGARHRPRDPRAPGGAQGRPRGPGPRPDPLRRALRRHARGAALMTRPSTAELLRYFLYLGSLGFGGLAWMQAAFYGVGAAVIGIITIAAWKLARLTLSKDRLQWLIFSVMAVVTGWTESELVSLFVFCGVVALVAKAPPAFLRRAKAACLVVATPDLLLQLFWFFAKAGAFIFGSGLAIVPFLYGGV